ncbi:MAG TPA: hypothetical protein VF469_12450, partial [Kofleriaceae bacterium]
MKPSVLVLLSAAAAACGSSSPSVSPGASVARPAPRERLAPCTVEGVTEKLLCGSYAVWENRTTRQGRKIDLHVVVMP